MTAYNARDWLQAAIRLFEHSEPETASAAALISIAHSLAARVIDDVEEVIDDSAEQDTPT